MQFFLKSILLLILLKELNFIVRTISIWGLRARILLLVNYYSNTYSLLQDNSARKQYVIWLESNEKVSKTKYILRHFRMRNSGYSDYKGGGECGRFWKMPILEISSHRKNFSRISFDINIKIKDSCWYNKNKLIRPDS